MSAPTDGVAQVEAFLATVQQPHRATLDAVRATLRTILPTATECLKYGMPCFVVDGKGVAAYAAFKQHCSYFPMSGGVLAAAGSLLDGYVTTSGSLHFAIDRPLPVKVVRRLVQLRLDEIAAAAEAKRARSTKR